MKKYISVLGITMLLSVKGNCQLEKGNWLVGGNLALSSSKYNSDAGQKNKHYEVQASPIIGYFLADKFSMGLKISLLKSGGKATGTSIWANSTELNIGPFIRYYLLPIDKDYNIVSEVSYQYGLSKSGPANQLTKLPSKNIFSLAAGPVLYINSSIGLEFLFGYSTYKYIGFTGSNTSLQFGIGLQVHLEKKNI